MGVYTSFGPSSIQIYTVVLLELSIIVDSVYEYIWSN